MKTKNRVMLLYVNGYYVNRSSCTIDMLFFGFSKQEEKRMVCEFDSRYKAAQLIVFRRASASCCYALLNYIRHHGISPLTIKLWFSAQYSKGFPSLKIFVSFCLPQSLLELSFLLDTDVKSCLLCCWQDHFVLTILFSPLLVLLALECKYKMTLLRLHYTIKCIFS